MGKIFLKALLLCFVWLPISFAQEASLSYSQSCDSRDDMATFSFVGDILIHKALYEAVIADTQHFSQIWRKTDSLIKKAHFSVGNLEGPAALGVDSSGRDRGDVGFVYDGTVYSGTNFLFNYHPRILEDLKKSGYDLLTMANNHSLDRRSLGIDKTLKAAAEVGIHAVGTRHSQERNGAFYKIVSVQNMRVAFLGCTEMTNGIADTKDQVLFCYKNPEKILSLIGEISSRSDVDAVIVLPHWGLEYKHTPEAQQKRFARKFLEAGAVAVMGSHPHVLQPFEKYVTQDGRETFIAYSLGNFVAGQSGLARKTGAVAYLGLSKTGHKKAQIFGVGYTPTFRSGWELVPVGSKGPKDVLDHVHGLFGADRRIEPTEDLLKFLCSKRY